MATLDKVAVDITVVLGTTSIPIHQVLRVGRGANIELDASEEDGRERQPHRRQCRRIASAAPRHALSTPQGPEAAPKLSLRPDGRQALSLNILFVTWSAIIGTRGFRDLFIFSRA